MKTIPEQPETPFDGLPILNLDEKGNPPEERLKKASVARSIFVQQRDADRLSAAQRALTQDLLDGGPPYEQSGLDEDNMGDVTNLNFGGAEQQLDRAATPYYRLFSSPDTLVRVSTLFGADEDRPDYDTIISEEITRLLRKSESIPFQTQKLINRSIWDGVGIGYWSDDIDWRYRASGFGHFYFDRQCDPCEADLECPTAFEEVSITHLWRRIKNRESAERNGWNYDACITAIQKASSADSNTTEWEKQLTELKNNDLSAPQGARIKLIHIWVPEFSGKISHYITTEDDQGTEDFLYKSVGRKDEMRQALVLFPWGIGTNTKLHSIRGLGFKVFPFEQQRNRSLSRLIDQGELASSLMVQAEDETGMSSVGLQYYGNLAVLKPEAKLVTGYTAPDLQRTVMPVLEEMERLRNERMAPYSTENVFDGDQRKTKAEITAHLDQAASLSDAQLDFFYLPFERLLRETVRRISRKTYVEIDPGGREIKNLHKRLLRRGVPLEALFQLDHDATEVVRAIGAGSAAAKTMSLTRLNELRPRMDDVGQANLDRDLAVDAVGSSNADRYFTRDGAKRTTTDTNIAILETQMLLDGREIPVLSSDKHLAHAREHIKPLLADYQAAEAGQVTYEEVAQRDALLYNHTADHVESASGDPSVAEEAAQMRQVMQRIGEVISNGLKALEAQQQEAAEEGGEAGQAPDGGLLAEVDAHRQKMKMRQDEFELEQRLKVQESQTRMAIADAEAAAKIQREAKVKKAKTP